MHIKTYIYNNVIGTLLSIKGKTKDSVDTCRDLKEMGIRRNLHPIQKDENWF